MNKRATLDSGVWALQTLGLPFEYGSPLVILIISKVKAFFSVYFGLNFSKRTRVRKKKRLYVRYRNQRMNFKYFFESLVKESKHLTKP